ncbi:SIS domain-containing protein [Sinomonas sp. ASV322]|uniref:SIS domain-containing protein n=1 Tax=Sinomonas sp. ASV322 TaxID=3041920 RepID=UPI0027DCC8DC|nr:SIS domain-containing protein [Sinomonas sp. ASV322]MDQ4501278.1 SIS domain-containing protein [Sinomonas sp. ASV322]
MNAQFDAVTTAWNVVGTEVAQALNGIDPAAFQAFCGLFEDRSRRWFFSGQGRSGLVAEMAAMRFMHYGFETHVLGESTAPSVRSGDGLLLVSNSGKTPVTSSFARIARAEGATIAVVTSNAASPLAEAADAAIELRSQGSGQFAGSLFEQGALLLLDAVVLDITGGDPATYARMAARHTNMQ